MNYTIAVTDEIGGDLKLEFGRNGNQYTVGLYNTETKDYTHRNCTSYGEAIHIYCKMVDLIVRSFGSEQYKRDFLQTYGRQ